MFGLWVPGSFGPRPEHYSEIHLSSPRPVDMGDESQLSNYVTWFLPKDSFSHSGSLAKETINTETRLKLMAQVVLTFSH